MNRLVAMAFAAAVYVLAAWLVAPGFFDGFAPPAPYRWVSPPPELKSSNQPPSSGRATITVQNGAAEAGHLYTTDQQAAITFPSRSFEAPPNGAALTLEIKPVASYPPLGGIVPAGNVYLVTVSTQIISPVVVTMRYGSQQSNPPGDIFAAPTSTAGWRRLGAVNTSVPYTVSASAQALGYFVVGYPPAPASSPAPAAPGGGPPLLLIVAGAAVALAVVAGLPLVAARSQEVPAAPKPEPEPPPPSQNFGGARRRRRRGRR